MVWQGSSYWGCQELEQGKQGPNESWKKGKCKQIRDQSCEKQTTASATSDVISLPYTSKQHTVVFLFHGNSQSLSEPVHHTLQTLIHAVLFGCNKDSRTVTLPIQISKKRSIYNYSMNQQESAQRRSPCLIILSLMSWLWLRWHGFFAQSLYCSTDVKDSDVCTIPVFLEYKDSLLLEKQIFLPTMLQDYFSES